jgi:subtilisin family serine protease
MVSRMLLCHLAIVALLIDYVGVVQAQEGGAPMIVMFHQQAAFDNFRGVYQADERERQHPGGWRYLNRDVLGAVQVLETALGFRADHVYSAALRGFAARLTAQQIRVLENHALVAYVEPDGIMKTQAQEIPWGIDRIGAALNSAQAGDGQGAITNVAVFIIDTGIDSGQGDLNVVAHVKLLPLPNVLDKDCHGHGTHVAGTAAAVDNDRDVVGVAPAAALAGVKVLSCVGVGSTSSVIKGVDLVTANGVKPGVVNMSLGGVASRALDEAVINSVNAGLFYAVAAGNENTDACHGSPSRLGPVDGVMSVAATDIDEQEASFSNYGNCVDVWAPGVGILSTKIGGGTLVLSGTSMASAHVAGAAALFLSSHPAATPAQVERGIKDHAVQTNTQSKDGRAIFRLNVGGF